MERSGDIWDVEQYPQSSFHTLSVDVWAEAESLLGDYQGKCKDACQLARRTWGPGWLDSITGAYANELGAPVGQAVRVVLLRCRSQQ